MGFKKGLSGNPNGRPEGTKNKLPRDLVERILQISSDLDEQGNGLQHCAEKDPKWFFENFLKPIIPKNIASDRPEQIIIQVLNIPKEIPRLDHN